LRPIFIEDADTLLETDLVVFILFILDSFNAIDTITFEQGHLCLALLRDFYKLVT